MGRPRRYPAATSAGAGTAMGVNATGVSKRVRGRGRSAGDYWLPRGCAAEGDSFESMPGDKFTPYIVTVHAGEDVAKVLYSLFHKDHQGICILSANGVISTVTIWQPGALGGLLTYEGRFEILSLTWPFTMRDADSGGVKSTVGGLSVVLAGPDGRVIGGGVAGLLRAGSPIQIVVGCFTPDGHKVQRRKHLSPSPNVPRAAHEPDHMVLAERSKPAVMPESPESARADMNSLPIEELETEEGDHHHGDRQNLNELDMPNLLRSSSWELILRRRFWRCSSAFEVHGDH